MKVIPDARLERVGGSAYGAVCIFPRAHPCSQRRPSPPASKPRLLDHFQSLPFVLWRAKVTVSIASLPPQRRSVNKLLKSLSLGKLKEERGGIPGGNQAPSPAHRYLWTEEIKEERVIQRSLEKFRVLMCCFTDPRPDTCTGSPKGARLVPGETR